MRDFQVLFDDAGPSQLTDSAYAPYGKLGFPSAPDSRPWIYANFVESVDGIVSLLGPDSSGADIAQSEEDRWLMDLLRAHADAILIGMGTLKTEQSAGRPRARGPIFRIGEPSLRQLREKLGHGPERNIFVTGYADFKISDFAVFDGDAVQPYIVTTTDGADELRPQLAQNSKLTIVVAGRGRIVDLPAAMRILREQHGIKHLICEGGPTLYANMLRASLIDEKFITVSPFEAGSGLPAAHRQPGKAIQRPTIFPAEGFTKDHMVRWQWLSCRRVANHQFHRYRRVL